VHDLEDGVVAGLIDFAVLAKEQDVIAALAAEHFCSEDTGSLPTVLAELLALPWWPVDYDGTAGAQAALKDCTSSLIGRFCRAAEDATRERFGEEDLCGYAGDLIVPERERLECALLKAITMRYVMGRPEAAAIQAHERDVVGELVARLADRAPWELEPFYRDMWVDAADDAARLRAVVDQVAALTDLAALGVHRRLSS
jgi:dGTPase